MKKILLFFNNSKRNFTFQLFAIFISTTFIFPSKVNAQFQFEPNDSFDEAYVIDFDVIYDAAIYQTGDVDFYEIYVPMGAVLEFNSFELPFGLEMRATIYDCPSELCSLTTLNLVENGTRYYKVCSSGTYYFKVFDAGNNESSQDLYSYGITLDSTDMCEFDGCNDVITDACLIETDQLIQAAINSFGDADYYKFEVPTESVININVQNIADDISMTTILYDAPNELSDLVTWTSNNSGIDVNRFYKICSPGTYYLKLFDNVDNDRSSQLYNLIVGIDSSDIYECNDTELTAYELQVCSDTLFAAINLEGDEDYFSFTAPANININIEVTNVPNNIDIELELYAPNGNLADNGSGNNGSNANLNYLTLQEGTYILRLYDDGNNEFNSSLYQLIINFIPEFNLPLDFQDLCIDEAPIQLSGGTPIGGYYSGVGVDSITGIFNPMEAGAGSHFITFTFSDTLIACTSSVSEEITVHDLPAGSFTIMDDTVFVSDSPFILQGGISMENGTYTGIGVDSITGVFNPSIAGIGTHEITYTITDMFGCSNAFLDSITVVQATSVISLSPDVSIITSPNPFSEKFNVEFNNLPESEVSISIFNLNGNRIYFTNQNITEAFEINLGGFPSGMYFIRFEIDEKLYSIKVLKK